MQMKASSSSLPGREDPPRARLIAVSSSKMTTTPRMCESVPVSTQRFYQLAATVVATTQVAKCRQAPVLALTGVSKKLLYPELTTSGPPHPRFSPATPLSFSFPHSPPYNVESRAVI